MHAAYVTYVADADEGRWHVVSLEWSIKIKLLLKPTKTNFLTFHITWIGENHLFVLSLQYSLAL